MVSKKRHIVRARDVMQKGIVYINGMATVKEAAAKMRAEHTSALMVEKRHSDDAWAIISVQDLIKRVIIPGRSSSDVNVYEIMIKPILPVPAHMDILYVSRLIYRAGIWRAPVEEQGELVGMISLSSLILDNELF